MIKTHSFHIPVMGTGFTIDTPLKVAQHGIDSVISIGDDILLEKLRRMYCDKYKIHYEEITNKMEDFRAKRITSYLNLLNDLASQQFEKIQNLALKKEGSIKEYLNMLPDRSIIEQEFKSFMEKLPDAKKIRNWINGNVSMGSIDVNIMTKLDKENYVKNEKQSVIYNDAHAALRGYANSDLTSSVVFSAGLNPRLYSYIEQFRDFHPDKNGTIKKKIIIKVSDYRSALIQGKFLAKKGLWVSEYRIESGLNCGGHAFATDGFLLGPILAEFRDKREELIQTTHEIYIESVSRGDRPVPKTILPLRITAQGGVGTAKEHQFLIDHYQIDSVGWGSPFLLVPEATRVDSTTLNKLLEAREEELYLSDVSPLGVQFNNLRGSTKEKEKISLMDKGKPGSPCVRKFLALSKEFSEKALCTASRKYQHLKIKVLDNAGVSPIEYQKSYREIVDKECLCTGLGTPALITNNIDTKIEGDSVSVCPGPNMAYFSKIMSLKEITDHIYGRANVITRMDRPNMFMKELGIYIDYLKNKIEKSQLSPTDKQKQYLEKFAENLNAGIDYYSQLFSNLGDSFKEMELSLIQELQESQQRLRLLYVEIENLSIPRKETLFK